jgi:hypothetical protein
MTVLHSFGCLATNKFTGMHLDWGPGHKCYLDVLSLHPQLQLQVTTETLQKLINECVRENLEII